jgi:hypothetical protein
MVFDRLFMKKKNLSNSKVSINKIWLIPLLFSVKALMNGRHSQLFIIKNPITLKCFASCVAVIGVFSNQQLFLMAIDWYIS